MGSISLVLYLIVTVVALFCAGYNFMYRKEIHRMESQVGITIPASLFQLLSAVISVSLFIAGLSTILFLISFLTRG